MFGSLAVSQTVVLAAGYGSRLGSAESGVPKPLMPVGGRLLIAHALEHARASGCSEAVIVIGHQGDRVRAAVEGMATGMRIRFVENADVATPNGLSLLVAEPLAADLFFLQMVDHLFAGVALTRLIDAPLGGWEAGRLLIDRTPGKDIDLADATKVRLTGAKVTAIGKGIEPWDAIDAGCFVLTPLVFDALRRVPATEPLSVSSGMRQLVASGALGTADVDGVEWIDVDTPSDRSIAELLLGAHLSLTPSR